MGPMSRTTTSPRQGVTLLEVLITIFIMGIGMLALLVLFPLGAVNMARALRDDRAAGSAVTAENIAASAAAGTRCRQAASDAEASVLAA